MTNQNQGNPKSTTNPETTVPKTGTTQPVPAHETHGQPAKLPAQQPPKQ